MRQLINKISRNTFNERCAHYGNTIHSEHHPPQCTRGSSSWVRAWTEQEALERVTLLLVLSGHPSSPALRHWHGWFSGLWTMTGTYVKVPLLLRPSDPDWVTPGFRWHIMELSLCHCPSQFQYFIYIFTVFPKNPELYSHRPQYRNALGCFSCI